MFIFCYTTQEWSDLNMNIFRQVNLEPQFYLSRCKIIVQQEMLLDGQVNKLLSLTIRNCINYYE